MLRSLAIDALVLLFAAGALGQQPSGTTATPSGTAATPSGTGTASGSGPIPQSSPAWLSNVQVLPGNVKAYPSDASKIPTGPLSNDSSAQALQGYPPPFKPPPTNSPDVQAVIQAIDWSKVPRITQRKANQDGSVNMQGYSQADPDCWWSASGCVKPKYGGLPEDIYFCPKVGDWGLTYDDGPLTADGGAAAEPELYNFLAQHQQKAGLFYIGSNVISAPAAAQRALADGHTLCSHTWSHPAMTAQSNEAVVAELYWALRAIKQVTGVTVKCWRPPFGDVDDRVRAIAWQMGMRTVLWDQDTDDWNMPGPGGGNLPPATVDGYFEGWIHARQNGTDNQHGHIILQHELNNATVSMAEKWLPKVKEVFNVVPFSQCMNMSNPYWEEGFVYPTDANPNGTAPAASPAQSPHPAETSHSAAPSSTVPASANVALLALACFIYVVV